MSSSVVSFTLFVVGTAGTVLLMAELPWFARRSLVERLRPYHPRGRSGTVDHRSTESVVQVLAPLAQQLGARLSRTLGVTEDLGLRLDRAGSAATPADFRVRQLTGGLASLLVAGAVALWAGLPLGVSLALVVGAPALAVLSAEQRLSSAGATRRRVLRSELPVVVEQLGLLLSAGYSVTGALTRLSRRSDGVIASDLRGVIREVRHGAAEDAALEAWAHRVDVDAVSRLVAVLALHRSTGDLGPLISDEARSVRAEAHRELLESIERRSQLVWVPVTVATLVPGLIFLAVPFISAMSQVTGT